MTTRFKNAIDALGIKDEGWVRIKEGCPYLINRFGHVKTEGFLKKVRGGHLRSTGVTILKIDIRNGYKSYRLNLGDGFKTKSVHRLLATVFIPNPNNYPVVNHIDGNKLNNSLENLEWCTVSHNTQHSYDMGLQIPAGNRKGFVGKDVHNSKPVIAYDLHGNYVASYESCKLAEKDGFIGSCVSRVASGVLKQHKGHRFCYQKA
ncbi:HNH endonuclease [Dyadobacter chenwenxiniae]|uniref:HNH endonuclease n=1 Tax=Dyadobacter chenwenxiniae TaxID=2906456 RepID=A0A9X1PH56_9BACT|nr:HNH endonuclease [Dyadobacter chenwenxiniae]MCF0059899.1 HNH endonuclease [Dyadobacter chenwenxiniae]UON85638.1 HNH endonuclease [Dyadobacter chenwenxiniae]